MEESKAVDSGNGQEGKLSAAERRRLRKAEISSARKAEKQNRLNVSGETTAENEEAMDPTRYYENRMTLLSYEQSERSLELYPHKFQISLSLADFCAKYHSLSPEEKLTGEPVAVAGRLMRVAHSGKNLRFFDLISGDVKIQIIASAEKHNAQSSDFYHTYNALRRGDIVGVSGFPGKSKTGELSIFATETKLLAPCLHMLPKGGGYQQLKDSETRLRCRYLDLMLNRECRRTFFIRWRIIKHIRTFLEDEGFQEVETPMMNLIAGGANARPFITHHNELETDFFLRVAPELYLKMLVVGGMEKVFEIGKNFRNEGVDLTHNPEFTSCEFYEAYADVYDLMNKTERMLSSLVKSLHGGYTTILSADDGDVSIDWTAPYRRISMIDEIERVSGKSLPRPFDSQEALAVMQELLRSNKIDLPQPPTAAKLLDKLCGHFIESKIVNPTFIIEHPQIMSPLAKWHRSKADVTERGELFVAGKEICNFYTELNDPVRQRECFMDQAACRLGGDEEGMRVDEDFCIALEHGLPPTGGWGVGIDRLTMYMTNNNSIKEVILFPAMRPQPVIDSSKQQ